MGTAWIVSRISIPSTPALRKWGIAVGLGDLG
jgi:hypothetical protein